MKLEEEIKQKKFRSEYQKLHLNILFSASWIHGYSKKIFDQYQLTSQQYNVLRILKGNHPKPYTTSEIRKRMLDRMSDASRIVDRLIQKKLVERKICKSDRRLVDVVITLEGLNLLDHCTSGLVEMEKIFHKVSEAEAKRINSFLDKLHS